MLHKKKGGGGGANWMDTYGDMVTLLLCFFVMLYSMSSVDQNRWIALVQALNPDAVVAQGSMEVAPPNGSVVTQEEIDQEIQELYESMEDYIQQANMTGRVSIGRGNGYVFVSFDDTVFFDGDRRSWIRSPCPLQKQRIRSMRSGCWDTPPRPQPMSPIIQRRTVSWPPTGLLW